MKRPSTLFLLLSLALAAPAVAQKKKPPKRTCQDGKPAADDGTCPEDYVRTCEDGQPAAEDGTCPEDTPPPPPTKYYDIPLDVRANIDLAVVNIDETEVGQTPLLSSARVSEGEHTLSIVFPGFEPYFDDITVDEGLTRRGITKSVELVPTNPEAKKLLDDEDKIERFLKSGLTVDGYVEYSQGKKIRNYGLLFLGGSLAGFGGFTAASLLLEDNQQSVAVTGPFTVGVVALLIGAPTVAVGHLKLKKARGETRDSEFLIKPPEPPVKEEPEEPASAPASAPASEPAPAP